MANRVWEGPFDWPTFDGTGGVPTSTEITEAVAEGAAVPEHDQRER